MMVLSFLILFVVVLGLAKLTVKLIESMRSKECDC